MNSDDSDSDGSDDIGNMLKHAHEVRQASQSSDDDNNDDDDDDDDIDTSSVELLTSKHSARKRKASACAKSSSSSSQLPTKRTAGSKDRSNSDDVKEKSFADFTDDDDDDEVDSNGDGNEKGESAKNVVNLVKTGPVISVDDDDSSDDDEGKPGGGGGDTSYRVRPVDQAAMQQLQRAHMVMMNFSRSNNRDVIQDIEREADVRSFSYETSSTAAAAGTIGGANHYLRLTICPRFDDKHASTKATLPEQVLVDIMSEKTVENLMDAFFQQAKLNKEKYTVGIKFGGNLLDPRKQLYKIKNLQFNSKLDAIVYLSTIVVHRNRGSSSNNNNNAAPAQASNNLGKAITVKVRNGKQEDLIQIHMKETFQVLVDKYRSLKKLDDKSSSKKIV